MVSQTSWKSSPGCSLSLAWLCPNMVLLSFILSSIKWVLSLQPPFGYLQEVKIIDTKPHNCALYKTNTQPRSLVGWGRNSHQLKSQTLTLQGNQDSYLFKTICVQIHVQNLPSARAAITHKLRGKHTREEPRKELEGILSKQELTQGEESQPTCSTKILYMKHFKAGLGTQRIMWVVNNYLLH